MEEFAILVVILSQQHNCVVRTLDPTPIAHRNNGQVAIKRLDHPLEGSSVRALRKCIGLRKLGKRRAQAMIIRSEDSIPRHAVGDFQGRRKGPAKDAVY